VLGFVVIEGPSFFHYRPGIGKSYMFRYDEKTRKLVK
jgi:hypothetical protein